MSLAILQLLLVAQMSTVAANSRSRFVCEPGSCWLESHRNTENPLRTNQQEFAGLKVRALNSKEPVLPEVNLRIRRVGLGSSYRSVLRLLGRPREQHYEPEPDTTCIPSGRLLKLVYKGMTIELLSYPKRGLTVVSMDVSTPDWPIMPGLRVGMDERQVRLKLGAPSEESSENNVHRFHYENMGNNGFAVVDFKGGVVARVWWESALC